jgi:hypothetical protein
VLTARRNQCVHKSLSVNFPFRKTISSISQDRSILLALLQEWIWSSQHWPLTPSMQQSSWEANTHSASHVISHLLLNPTFHYCVHNSPPLAPILSQVYWVYIFPPFPPKIHSNLIFPSTFRSS